MYIIGVKPRDALPEDAPEHFVVIDEGGHGRCVTWHIDQATRMSITEAFLFIQWAKAQPDSGNVYVVVNHSSDFDKRVRASIKAVLADGEEHRIEPPLDIVTVSPPCAYLAKPK